MRRPLLVLLWLASALRPQTIAPQKPKLRVAHIGFELDGSWKFSRDVTLSPDAELVAVADRHEDLLAKAQQVLPKGLKAYRDYVAMLDEVKPDAVVSTTPNSEHLAIVRECARRRIPVWFQKPAAATAAEARQMLALARESGITVMVSDHTQFTPAAQTIQARIRDGLIGPVERLHVHHRFFASKTLSPYYENYFRDDVRHGGGALMDQGTYGINWAVCLLGRPKTVYAVGHNFQPGRRLRREDYGVLILTYPNATVVVEAGWWATPDHGKGGRGELWAFGPRGSLWRDDTTVHFEPAIAKAGDVSQPKPLDLVSPAPQDKEGVAHFLHALRWGGQIAHPHTLATHVLINEIVEKAYESIRTGEAVPMGNPE